VPTPKTFQSTLETRGMGPEWVALPIPFNPTETWPECPGRTALRVRGALRAAADPATPAHPIATSLFGAKTGGYFLLITQKMRKATGLAVGDLAEVTLEPDIESRAATPPPELARLLKQDRAVKRWFDRLSYSFRKYISEQVAEPKSTEVRERRAELWMERMMLIMDGEKSTPPILQAAFRRQPGAAEGWQAMTPNQRRMTLYGIYICQSPEARAKRLEMALADVAKAARRAEKARGRSNPRAGN